LRFIDPQGDTYADLAEAHQERVWDSNGTHNRVVRMPSGPAAALGGAQDGSRRSIWPAIYPRLLELILEHRSTIVFVNSRRLAERLAARLNELAGEDLVKAHHGSIAKEHRRQIEDDLKEGRLRGLVATSSLELGIDMGAVDPVLQGLGHVVERHGQHVEVGQQT